MELPIRGRIMVIDFFATWCGPCRIEVPELARIDRFVRRNTVGRFGPVREVVHEPDQGLVLEVAFEGLQRSTRHKSGIAMRFPRISRLRWDKRPADADRLEVLERMLEKIESGRAAPTAANERDKILS